MAYDQQELPPVLGSANSPSASRADRLSRDAEIIAEMQRVCPPGSGEPTNSHILAQLRTLTKQLIRAYRAAGQLQADPFGEAVKRSIYLHKEALREKLRGKTVVVTGGEGCVGSRLVHTLGGLGSAAVISIDKRRLAYTYDDQPLTGALPIFRYYAADVRSQQSLERIFAREKPHIVFHLSAQRNPGLAERLIHETITSNVLGTQNVTAACEKFGVEHCVFSSTGKASRYLTSEVYAASKKLAEWQLLLAAASGPTTYNLVRFTHMLENSLVSQHLDQRIAAGCPINIHEPQRFVVAQNLVEAERLLLNALALAEPRQLKLHIVRNLGWPIETLEVALYRLQQSGRDLPVYFEGVPVGYEECFFAGEIDWSNKAEIHTLINVLESGAKTFDASGDMVVTRLAAISLPLVGEQLALLRNILSEPSCDETSLKSLQANVIRTLAADVFQHAPTESLLKILKWGSQGLPSEAASGRLQSQVLRLVLHNMAGRQRRDARSKGYEPAAVN